MRGMFKYLLVLLVALGSASAPAAFWKWSKTSSINSSIDPSINWLSGGGMAPSGIDPDGRAMMARIAEYRDDISGALATTGTAIAYVVSTHQLAGGVNMGLCGSGSTPNDGQLIAVTPNLTSGASPTLTVDGCSAIAIQAGPIAVPAGTLISGTPYSLKYSVANTAWMLREFFGNPYGIPVGGLMPYTATTAPNSNFILPAGQCISTTTYAGYWALLGSPVPGGCGAGTFAALDTRARTPIAYDNLNGTAASRLTSSAAGCGAAFTSLGVQCGGQSQTLTLAQLPTGIVVANASQSISTTGPTNITMYSGGSDPGSESPADGNNISIPFGGGFGANSAFTYSGSNSLSMTSNNTSGGAHPNVQPVIAVVYLLRVI